MSSDSPLNLYDVGHEENICVICQEDLSKGPCYELPECNHTYHTNCIVNWFRTRNNYCPYCGNKGINNIDTLYSEPTYQGGLRRRLRSWREDIYSRRIRDIKHFANTHECPASLKRDLEQLKAKTDNFNNAKRAYTDYKKKLRESSPQELNITFSEAEKELIKLKQSKWQKQQTLLKMKKYLFELPIIPLIIPMYVDLNCSN